jgi:hypothetical protein
MNYKRSLAGIAGLVGSLALAPNVSWADYCLAFPTVPTFTMVGRGFVIPAKGQCKLWIGFTPSGSSNSPSAGTACTSSDGSNLSLTITTMQSGQVFFDSISMALPAQTGTDDETLLGTGSASATVDGAKCTPKSNPIPAAFSGTEVSGQQESPDLGIMGRP